MKFTLKNDILAKAGALSTWVEQGEYPVVRVFDSNKVLIDVGTNGMRILTVVSLSKGTLAAYRNG